MKYFKTSFLVILIFLLPMCKNEIDVEYIKSNQWIHLEGFKIGQGDYIKFNETETFKIKDDTILYRDVPRAVVIKLNKKVNEMIVRSINGSEEGTYINTDEFRK